MEKTVEDILNRVHRIYEGDTDYLEFEDDESELRFGHLVDGIDEWMDRFPEYRETFASLSTAVDGDTVTEAGVTEYDCPTNFVRPSNIVKIGSTVLTYISPSEIALKNEENTQSPWFTITGRPGAYKLRINPTPTGADTISYDYWKTIAYPVDEESVIEMSRPLFLVYYILHMLYLDDDTGLALKYEEKMLEQERLERVALAKTPGTPNRLTIRGAGFGKVRTGILPE